MWDKVKNRYHGPRGRVGSDGPGDQQVLLTQVNCRYHAPRCRVDIADPGLEEGCGPR